MDRFVIRQECPGDYEAVAELVERAFRDEQHSDHREHLLVERLRASDAFIPSLALVCQAEEGIAGYILLSRVTVGGRYLSLALAPVAVSPRFQGRGMGAALIEEAHRRAAAAGYGSVIVLGHPGYYPRFGYRPLSGYGIRLPFDAPGECCMGVELRPGALDGVQGTVEYPAEFLTQ